MEDRKQDALGASQTVRWMISQEKLQHIYDRHAADFGLTEKKNGVQLELLRDALSQHLNSGETLHTRGLYRGEESAIYYHDLNGIVIVLDRGDHVLAAFKASAAQLRYITTIGRLN